MYEIDSVKGIIPQNTRNINVSLTDKQTLSIVNKTFTKKPGFIMVASGYKESNMNYTKELLSMTPQEAFMFNLLMDNRETPDVTRPYIKSNFTYIDSTLLTKSEKKKIYEGYKRLHKKDLIVRIARGKYIINPQLVITNDELYSIELGAYAIAKGKTKGVTNT